MIKFSQANCLLDLSCLMHRVLVSFILMHEAIKMLLATLGITFGGHEKNGIV